MAVAAALAVIATRPSPAPAKSAASLPSSTSKGFIALAATTAPSFTVPSVDPSAGDVDLAALRGRPVVLNFWSSTCVVCAEEAPGIRQVYDRVRGRATFIGLDTIDLRQNAIDFARRTGADWTLGFDPSGAVAADYHVAGLPTTFFIDGRGVIRGEFVGDLDAPTLTHLLKSLLGVSP